MIGQIMEQTEIWVSGQAGWLIFRLDRLTERLTDHDRQTDRQTD